MRLKSRRHPRPGCRIQRKIWPSRLNDCSHIWRQRRSKSQSVTRRRVLKVQCPSVQQLPSLGQRVPQPLLKSFVLGGGRIQVVVRNRGLHMGAVNPDLMSATGKELLSSQTRKAMNHTTMAPKLETELSS